MHPVTVAGRETHRILLPCHLKQVLTKSARQLSVSPSRIPELTISTAYPAVSLWMGFWTFLLLRADTSPVSSKCFQKCVQCQVLILYRPFLVKSVAHNSPVQIVRIGCCPAWFSTEAIAGLCKQLLWSLHAQLKFVCKMLWMLLYSLDANSYFLWVDHSWSYSSAIKVWSLCSHMNYFSVLIINPKQRYRAWLSDSSGQNIYNLGANSKFISVVSRIQFAWWLLLKIQT